MVLPDEPIPRYVTNPDNLATIEHLDDRFSDKRGTYVNTPRTVLACSKCNRDRGRAEEEKQGVEELRQRAKNGHR